MRQPITGVRDPAQQREGNQDHCQMTNQHLWPVGLVA